MNIYTDKNCEFCDKVKSLLGYFLISVIFTVVAYGFYETIHLHKYLINKLLDKAHKIETYIEENQISLAEDILLKISTDIYAQSLVNKPDKLIHYLTTFDSKFKNDVIKFTKMVFITSDHHEVGSVFMNKKYIQTCYDEHSEDFFKIKVSPIRNDYDTGKLVIPINMSIPDVNGKYSGTICTGFFFHELEEDIKNKFGRTNKEVDVSVTSELPKNIIKILDLRLIDLIKWGFPGQKLTIAHRVEDKPFFIILKLTTPNLYRVIYRSSLITTIISLITIIIIFLILKSMDDFYKKPLLSAYKKLRDFNESSNIAGHELFNPEEFADQVMGLINKCYELSYEKTELMTNHLDSKNRLMKIVFLERFITSNAKEEKLFISKIENMINEESTLIQIDDFFSEIIEYCNDFFDIKICKDVDHVQNKSFVFKKFVLTETIFNIFSFIKRSQITNQGLLTISIKFVDENYLPIIIIKSSNFTDNNRLSHTSLLSINALAKENNLFLNIKKTNNDICFILEPFLHKKHLYDLLFVKKFLSL
jgi:hypothetical protein